MMTLDEVKHRIQALRMERDRFRERIVELEKQNVILRHLIIADSQHSRITSATIGPDGRYCRD